MLDVDTEAAFVQVVPEVSMVMGGQHIGSLAFPLENRGQQSSAVAAVALVVSSLHAPSTWNPALVDAILKYGDVLHTECSRLKRPGARNLSPSEILPLFVVGDVRARIRLQRNFSAGIVLEQDLVGALRLFFAKNSRCIFHTANYALALVEHWSRYYTLDPTERNNYKKSGTEGAACLFKCESISKLAKLIVKLCGFKEPTIYTLNAVEIAELHCFAQ